MKVTVGWLREYLDTPLEYKKIVQKLADLGFEIKKEYVNPSLWKNIEIVKIVEKEPHPNADKLHLYTISKKNGEITTIVCGDPSLDKGDFVPYAIPGTVMANGVALKTAKIRGIDSPGMLCAPSEICLPIQNNEVLKCFEEDWGKTIAQAYESEAIFEIELTPNRGDALSILGIARTLAQGGFGTLKKPIYNDFLTSEQSFFEIKSSDCTGLICTFFQYKIKNTPAKIAKRLQLIEQPVLNLDVVDLTNYISHDIGQPLHVFDYDKIKNEECSLENLDQPENFKTLANQIFTLDKKTLVFKSGKHIISWPGVIGGHCSKVDKDTTSLLLETGVFKADPIQRRKHGVVTSASKKTEYGINPFALKIATNAFFTHLGTKPISQQYTPFEETKKISFNFRKVKEILGIDITFESFEEIMTKKDFVFNNDGTITPPDYKFFDITTENCIVEDFAIGRYGAIESINLPPKYITSKYEHSNIDSISLHCGFNECKNISLGKKEHPDFCISIEGRNVKNVSNQNYAVLRGSLIPDLLKNLSWHNNHKQQIQQFFETGLIYGSSYPNKQRLMYTAVSTKPEDIQQLLSKILIYAQLDKKIHSKTENIPYSENSSTFWLNGKKIAIISSIKPSILREFKIKQCYALEIFLDNLKQQLEYNTAKPSELSPIYQDVTFKLEETVPSYKITNILNEKNISYKILSIFPSNNLNKARNLTIQFKLEQEKPLTKEEINAKITYITDEVRNHLDKEASLQID